MPNRVAVETRPKSRSMTVVKLNGERFWLVWSVDPDTNVTLHVRL
jgi:transposase-like protein